MSFAGLQTNRKYNIVLVLRNLGTEWFFSVFRVCNTEDMRACSLLGNGMR